MGSRCIRPSVRRLSVAGVVLLAAGLLFVTQSGASPFSRRAVDPRLFASGSCVEFEPTSSDRHETVFLDAGHGGPDPGGVGVTESGQTIYEANETLPVERDATALLRRRGFTVVDSRTGDSTVARLESGDESDGVFTVQGEHDDVAARDVCANRAKANILIGIYFDVGDTPQNAGSITGYDADRSFSSANLRLANLVQDDVLTQLNAQGWNIPNAGVVSDVYLGGPPLTGAAGRYDHLLLLGPADPGYFTTPSAMPGALIEPLFITDPFEGSIAASSRGQEAIARGLTQAVEQYFAAPISERSRKKA